MEGLRQTSRKEKREGRTVKTKASRDRRGSGCFSGAEGDAGYARRQ